MVGAIDKAERNRSGAFQILNPIVWRSSLAGTLDCMQKAKFFIDDVKPTGGWSMHLTRGIDLHSAAEEYLQGAMPDIRDDYNPHWVKLKRVLDSLEGNIAAVELPLARDDGDFYATGRLDALTKDDWILDWKITGKAWNAQRFLDYTEKQGNLYLWLSEGLLGRKPAGMKYIVVPEKEAVQTWELPWKDERIDLGLRGWKASMEVLRANQRFDNWPPDPSPWKCRWCNYKSVCQYSVAT